MSVLRVTVINLKETPKFLLGQNRDEEVVETLQAIATKYNRPCSLTVEQLEACGTTLTTHTKGSKKNIISGGEIWIHLKGLFLTRKLALSTCLIWLVFALTHEFRLFEGGPAHV